eukprot:snap_masked-scaffold_7-processed-gene-1.29-mRNA-1 protein AED:1.00 eAED:1.00 QI:0/0/0/0/1/1/2/0/109
MYFQRNLSSLNFSEIWQKMLCDFLYLSLISLETRFTILRFDLEDDVCTGRNQYLYYKVVVYKQFWFSRCFAQQEAKLPKSKNLTQCMYESRHHTLDYHMLKRCKYPLFY